MNTIGIIVEYNPFHNGHLYHLNKIKEMFPDSIIIAVMSGNFTQRGEASIINKWDKTIIALEYGVDLVIELPYVFATQSADIFAKGSIQLLKEMKVDTIVFGSESNDIDKLINIAKTQIKSKKYTNSIRKHLDQGMSYAKALSKSLEKTVDETINTPNDILGISYIREILLQKANIKPICIKRTNDYNSTKLTGIISSASSIREAIRRKENVSKYVPKLTNKILKNKSFFIENYFPFLKYKILSELNNLNKYQTVDEGIENRIVKTINSSKSLNELIYKVKTKRYTYNKLRRMFTHILNNFTKEEAKKNVNIKYIRILGFNINGRNYLNSIKKHINIPIITNYSKYKELLDIEYRINAIYSSVLNEEEKEKIIHQEFNKPINKN